MFEGGGDAVSLVAVGLGGLLGTLLRYTVGLLIPTISLFPLGTLCINWAGCIFLGWFFTITVNKWTISPNVRLGIGTGVTGAFTTFSTFSVDTVTLLRDNHALLALVYVLSSILVGIFLVWIGFLLARQGQRKVHQ